MKTITLSRCSGNYYVTIRGIRGQQSYEREALNVETGEWEKGKPVTSKHNPYSHYRHVAYNTEAIVTIGGVQKESYIEIAKLALEMGVTGYTTRRMLLEGKKASLLPPVNSVI